MPRLEKTIEAVFADRDIMPDEVPQLDLYMDQVLTLFDQCLSGSKRMQLLCVYHLKQTLRLNDVKALTGRDDVDFAACYEHLLADKKRMREAIPPLLTAQLPETPDDPEERLCTCLALSEIANYLRRLCESMIDDIPQQTEGD